MRSAGPPAAGLRASATALACARPTAVLLKARCRASAAAAARARASATSACSAAVSGRLRRLCVGMDGEGEGCERERRLRTQAALSPLLPTNPINSRWCIPVRAGWRAAEAGAHVAGEHTHTHARANGAGMKKRCALLLALFAAAASNFSMHQRASSAPPPTHALASSPLAPAAVTPWLKALAPVTQARSPSVEPSPSPQELSAGDAFFGDECPSSAESLPSPQDEENQHRLSGQLAGLRIHQPAIKNAPRRRRRAAAANVNTNTAAAPPTHLPAFGALDLRPTTRGRALMDPDTVQVRCEVCLRGGGRAWWGVQCASTSKMRRGSSLSICPDLHAAPKPPSFSHTAAAQRPPRARACRGRA